jgi:hypothetical protein
MAKARVFTSFDFDHDGDLRNLRNLLVGQSKNTDSSFEMVDWSDRRSGMAVAIDAVEGAFGAVGRGQVTPPPPRHP